MLFGIYDRVSITACRTLRFHVNYVFCRKPERGINAVSVHDLPQRAIQ